MITLITGTPGSGKTAAVMQILHERWAGKRPIFANINGLKIEHQVIDPTLWHELCPTESVVIVDECQRVWRNVRTKPTPDVIAMETHRHEGVDFYLISQAPTQINPQVRALVGRHIHLRDVGYLGRWWYEWPECTAVARYKSAPIKKRYKLPKSVFGMYESAKVHVKPIRAIPPALAILAVAVLGAAFLVWKAKGSIQARVTPPAVAASGMPGLPPDSPGAPKMVTVASATKEHARPEPAESEVEFAGCIAMAKRCECIDVRGKSREVKLEACEQNATRSGVGIPYAVQAQHVSGRPGDSRLQPVRQAFAKQSEAFKQ